MKETLLSIIAGIIMICGMVGSVMIAYAMWYGYWFFLTGSILGVYWCYQKRTYTLMALDAFYVGANLLGIYNQILT